MANPRPVGNRTARRGSRFVQRLTLTPEAARSLKVLVLASGQAYNPETASAWVNNRIEADWAEYDAEIQALVEQAEEWDGETVQ